MDVAAEPRPAELPLPGGREGASVRLHALQTGEMDAPPGFLARPGKRLDPLRTLLRYRRTEVVIPVPAFLVEHPGAGPILVDTGLHPSVAVDPRENIGLSARFLRFRATPEQSLPAQLRAGGIDPDDIGVVVMTHLHNDHASCVSEFPNATFVVAAAEWRSALEPRPALRGYQRRQFDHAFDWRTIDYDRRDVDSFATFGRSIDLFGDGSVRLVFTPGHSAGHQSVILRLRGREALLTGDAAFTRRQIDDLTIPAIAADEHNFRRSLREIQGYLRQTPAALVIAGHDPETWPELQGTHE